MTQVVEQTAGELLEGMVVSGYELVAWQGNGIASEVWEARCQLVDADIVALKIVPREIEGFSAADTQEIVLREAALMRELSDRARVPRYINCRAYESDALAGRYGWVLVMEHLDGSTLDERLRTLLAEYLLPSPPSGPVPPHEMAHAIDYDRFLREHLVHIVDLFIDLARTTQALHDAKRLHLDIKPLNIQLKRGQLEEQPSLMDFNIARFTDDGGKALTEAAQGTLEYAPPEQYFRPGLPDAKSDVYSLGASLYHALTLVPPHCSLDQHGEPVTPATRGATPLPIEQVNPRVDKVLAAIVSQALSADPARRQPSAAAFLADLVNWRQGATNPALGSQQVEIIDALDQLVRTLKDLPACAAPSQAPMVVPMARVREMDLVPHFLKLVQEGVLSLDPAGFRLNLLSRGAAHHFIEQNLREPLEKYAIGHAVGWLLAERNYRVVSVDGGSTALWVLRVLSTRDLAGLNVPLQVQLTNLLGLRDVTNVPLKAQWHVLPGTLRCETGVLVDQVVAGLSSVDVRAYAAIVGINQFDVLSGNIGTNLPNEREIKEELIHRALEEVFVAINPEKMGRRGSAPLKAEANLPALLAQREKKLTIVTARPVRYYDSTQPNHAAASAHHQRVVDFFTNLKRFLAIYPGKFQLRLFRVPILMEDPTGLVGSDPQQVDASPGWLEEQFNRFEQGAPKETGTTDNSVIAVSLEYLP